MDSIRAVPTVPIQSVSAVTSTRDIGTPVMLLYSFTTLNTSLSNRTNVVFLAVAELADLMCRLSFWPVVAL